MAEAEGVADADAYRIPDAPSLGGACRDAIADLYYNSWRLLPANLAWGLLFLGVLYVTTLAGVGGFVLVPLLAIPLVGVYRLAALIAREDGVGLRDAVVAWVRYAVPAVVVAAGAALVAAAFGANLVLGAATGDVVALALAIAASWALLVTWAYVLLFWPLLVDPRRADEPVSARARTAAVLLVASPGRALPLAVTSAFLLGIGAALFAALLTIAIAYVALVGARFVLPEADRLEGRATTRIG